MIKVNFYIPDNDVYLNGRSLEDIKLSEHTFFTSSERAWIIQTYLHLKSFSSLIICSDELMLDAINVVHCDEMLKNLDIDNHFIVSIVADRRVHLSGNLAIVQNYDQITSRKDHWIMHWPQTNLLSSTRNDKECVFRIGFLGLEKNSINLKDIVNRSKYQNKIEVVYRGPGEWHDYSDLDAVVAIRNFSSKHSQKPPTKLVNAWRAGVVFIGGNDSAYEQIGIPGFNYIKCQSPDELVSQIDRLVECSEQRFEIVIAGKESAMQFTDSKIASHWLDFFEKIGSHEFECWQKQGVFTRKYTKLYRFLIYTILRAKRFLLIKAGKY